MRFSAIAVFFLSLGSLHASEDVEAPWGRHTFDFEAGGLWGIGDNTTIDYQLVQAQFSWRSPYMFKFDLDGGSTVVVRNQVSLITSWIEAGPEDYYLGASAAPSLEWWSADNRWSAYLSVGGGAGVTNSDTTSGGLGQDLILNWFAKAGVRHQISKDFAISGGPMFQHMSDGGMSHPNPGIDALGFMLGASFSF